MIVVDIAFFVFSVLYTHENINEQRGEFIGESNHYF